MWFVFTLNIILSIVWILQTIRGFNVTTNCTDITKWYEIFYKMKKNIFVLRIIIISKVLISNDCLN